MSDQTNEIADRLLRLKQKAAIPDEEARAFYKQRDIDRHNQAVQFLRNGWNAPARQVARTPSQDGPWGEKLAALRSQLGKGFLVALIGNRGAGKTQLAVELMRATTEAGNLALFRTAMEFLMRLKASYRKDSEESELDVIRAHRKPRLLVIDEIARRGETEWENNVLFELLNQRYADTTDTVLTCNLSRQEFEASLGPSIISRMREGGGIIECNWPSFRS